MPSKTDTGHMRLFYRHDGSTFCVSEPINDEPATFANGSTVAFKCTSPEQVRAFHDIAVEHGGISIEDAPGLRNSIMGPVHLAYVRDRRFADEPALLEKLGGIEENQVSRRTVKSM